MILNPARLVDSYPDEETKEMMEKTAKFFHDMGLKKLKEDYEHAEWYSEFIEFLKSEKIFAKLFTPEGYREGGRWDTSRIVQYAELLGFFGINYWYCFQVTALGLGPIFIGKNEKVKKRAAELLEKGEIFGFGLSEKEHGADIYSTEMELAQVGEGYKANGTKYYIGNGNEAAMVATFGKLKGSGDYVFFIVDPDNAAYECVQNVVNWQSYVAEYTLTDYEISEDDITDKGREAWDAALNTVNIMKFNLGWGAIGMCSHAFYEALNHASSRRLFDHYVTDFPHIKQFFTEAYARLVAMRLFALRATDYMRSANKEDRRYLLYNPMVKMKVTTQGEEVINLLWEIIAAKGFEKSVFFSAAATDIRGLPKLEGTVHVNMALIIKFMKNYFFHPGDFPEVGRRDDAKNDGFLFDQGATRGLGKIKFHDYRPVYEGCDLPNVVVFRKQINKFKQLLVVGKPNKEQAKDFDFLLILGELFTLVVYGQLILENRKLLNVNDDLIDRIFDFMVRDFSKFALQLYGKPSATFMQKVLSKRIIDAPRPNSERFNRVWMDQVYSLKDTYVMPK